MGFKHFLAGQAQNLGYRIIPNWRLGDLALEEKLTEIFTHFSITTVFDVGANTGQYRDFLRNRIGFRGTIHSFEPQPNLVERIRQRAQLDDDWHIHDLGLGNSMSELTMNVMAKDTFSSFCAPRDRAEDRFTSSTTIVKTISVPVRKLDDLLPDLANSCAESCYLKIDTQGYDLEVLKGASSLLQDIRALQFEWAVQPLYAGVPHYLDMLKTLNDLASTLQACFQSQWTRIYKSWNLIALWSRDPCSGISRKGPSGSLDRRAKPGPEI